jgi:ABC-type branched-subunit amino acid transport system substrate-binding protein
MAFARSLSGADARQPFYGFCRWRLPQQTLAQWSFAQWRPAAAVAMLAFALGVAGCGPTLNSVGPPVAAAPAVPADAAEAPNPALGTGSYKVALVLPLSATGNAGGAAQAMRSAAEMAMAEFGSANIQLLPKDDAGTAQGAQTAVQQAIDEGAQVILGPLFAYSVTAAKPIARNRSVPIIAFSTDSSVAAPGAYLLSFLPESDVERAVAYAVSQGKKSFIGLVPATAYGSVAEGEFKQSVARRGGRLVAVERYGDDRNNKIGDVAKALVQSASQADALFIPDGDSAGDVVAALAAAGFNVGKFMILGTQLWDDPKVFANPQLEGALFAGPDPAGFRSFTERYRSRYRDDPPRPAALAYDAVSLIVSLTKAQQSGQRITNEVLTNPSGFAGIDGVFRFRNDGTSQRGLAILKVTSGGAQVVSPAPRSFSASAT